MGQNLSGTGAR
jgi:hypothetical protein